MKKLVSILLALLSIVSIIGCGNEEVSEEKYCAECSAKELMELMDSPEPELRAKAAAECGRFDDLSFLPKLQEILDAPDEAGLHAAALKSLAALWYDSPGHENIHEEAYVILLDYLSHEPGEPLPDMEAFIPFTEKVNEKWLLSANWFIRDELILKLEAIKEDPLCSGDYLKTLNQAIKILNAIQASLPGGCNLSW